MKRTIVLLSIIATLYSCGTLVPALFIPAKEAKLADNQSIAFAEDYFIENFWAGNYDSIPEMTERLTNAYYQNKNDWRLAAHLGWAHIWAIAEADMRGAANSAEITNHIRLSRKFFEIAHNLNPKEARVYGFLANATMSEGAIDGDTKQIVKGYFMMKKAIKMYPEFNYFTAAVTNIGSGDPKLEAEAEEYMWKTIDVCLDEKADRDNPDYTKYMSQATRTGHRRVCWNNDIAPHNFEGFLLIFGDLLWKRNKPEQALQMYENAKLSAEYDAWIYKDVLLERIEKLKTAIAQNTASQRAELAPVLSCMVCHQKGESELGNYVHE